ncbi:MAG: hypothetical protein RLZ81_956 [Pseudomonadota bacterium]|jgi:predicted secreted protein
MVSARRLQGAGLGLWLLWASAAWAQTPAGTAPPPQNVVQLGASGTVEVQQDLLVITLSTSRDGADAAVVQAQLRSALDGALAEAKAAVQAGQLDVRTGQFSLHPRYGRDGKLNGWQGSVELVLEGRDFARLGATAGRIQSLTVASMAFALSRERRQQVEAEAQAMAIERFKQRASEIARSFGFASYTLREVAVNASDYGPPPRPRVMALEARAVAADAPIPVEAGKTAITVAVSGSVQLK